LVYPQLPVINDSLEEGPGFLRVVERIPTKGFPVFLQVTLTKLDKGLHMLLLFILFFGMKLNIDVEYYNEHIGNDDVTAINGNGNS